MATLTVYSGAGDGFVGSGSKTTWDAAHDDTTGSDVGYSTNTDRPTAGSFGGASNYNIRRGFIPLDTSSLPGGAIVTTATLDLYIQHLIDADNDSQAYVSIVQTSQASSSSLVTGDIDNVGSTKGSDDLDITNLTDESYETWTLNATGRRWIDAGGTTYLGIREGHDIEDVAVDTVSNWSFCRVYASEEAGTTQDPKLTINYNESLVQNANLDDADTGWSFGTGFSRSSADAYSGSYSVAQSSTSGYDAVRSNEMTVTSSATYTITFWYKVTVNSGSAPTLNIYTTNFGFNDSVHSATLSDTSGAWAQYSSTFDASATSTSAWVNIKNNNGNVTAYYDDFEVLYDSGPPASGPSIFGDQGLIVGAS